MMSLRVNGVTFEGFTSSRVSKSISDASGVFSFTATSEETKNFPITRMAKVEVFIDGILIMSGFVDVITIEYSHGSHSLTFSGRDKTSILIDSSIPGNRRFNSPIDLKQVAEEIIKRLGSDLLVDTDIKNLKKFTTPLEAKVSQTAYQFLEQYARKSNVMLTSSNDGNLVIYESDPKKIDTIILHDIGNIENNVLSANLKFDDSKRFSKYTVYSQKSGNESGSLSFSFGKTPSTISNKNQSTTTGQAEDDGALPEKQKIMILESDGSIEDANNRAKWEANIRRNLATAHDYTMQGFFHSRGLWEINQLARVVDEYATIDAFMLINTVDYSFSLGGGSTTKLGVIGPDAYQLKPSVTQAEKNSGTLTWKLP